MADKMMRIAGRDSNGSARAIKTSENGNVEVVADAQFTYGWLTGSGGPTASKGYFDDWVFAKGANEGVLGTGIVVSTQNGMIPYLGYTAFSSGQSDTWVGVPIATKGYRTFHVGMSSSLNVDCDISAYLLPEIEGDFNGANIKYGLLSQTILSSEVLSNSSVLNFGIGGVNHNVYNAWTAGYLVIKISATGVPTSGAIRFGVERQK